MRQGNGIPDYLGTRNAYAKRRSAPSVEGCEEGDIRQPHRGAGRWGGESCSRTCMADYHGVPNVTSRCRGSGVFMAADRTSESEREPEPDGGARDERTEPESDRARTATPVPSPGGIAAPQPGGPAPPSLGHRQARTRPV